MVGIIRDYSKLKMKTTRRETQDKNTIPLNQSELINKQKLNKF